tara:strand:+ start:456 stop:662 length:207 start_codon:yes stop_codon:yes gene_type:complete
MFKESVKRTIAKAIGIRIIGLFMTFSLISLGNVSNIVLAIEINVAALIVYFLYERVWNCIRWGKITDG